MNKAYNSEKFGYSSDSTRDIKLSNSNSNNSNSYNKPRFIESRIKALYIDPDNISFKEISSLLLSKLSVGVNYSLLYKIEYNGGYFSMLRGGQDGIKLLNCDDTKSLQKMYKNFKKSLKYFWMEYSPESIDIIQVLYVSITDIPKLKLRNIRNVTLNKEFLNVNSEKEKFNSMFLPLSTDYKYFGSLLVNDKRLIYLNKINEEKNLLSFNDKGVKDIDSMYLYNNEYIILNKKLSEGVLSREVYDADTGKSKCNYIDTILGAELFSRKSNKLVIYIHKDKVICLRVTKELGIIKYIPKGYAESPSHLIGSIDLEAYDDSDGISKVYALGFVILGEKPVTFYIDKGLNNYKLVVKCFDTILSNSKYDGYTFYTHNFSNYDSVFILKILKEVNLSKGFDYYKLEPLYRDSKVIKLVIKVRKELSDRKQSKIGARKEPVFNKITIVDSYALLPGSLFNLSRSFEIDTTKGHFPHKFVKKDTLFYKGITPPLSYWKYKEFNNDIYDYHVGKDDYITLIEYNKLYSKDWNLKRECLIYLNRDLISLVNIMNTFNKYIFRHYDLDMTKSATISRLALNIYLKDYLKQSRLPVIKSNMYKDIKHAYFGGVTEVYKPYGKDLYYYDVNSLYPFSSLNYIPGNKCIFEEDFTTEGLKLNNLFGFYYCEIETWDGYLGLLPVHHNGVIMPNGKWEGWYFTEELKYAVVHNYKIKVIKGYGFDKQDNVFNEYVHDLYKVKSSSNGAVKEITKSLLNNLLGRFGMDVNKPKTEIVTGDKLEEIVSTRFVESYPKEITHDDYLISYYPEISKEICESHDKDYVKVYTESTNKIDIEKDKGFSDVSLTTAAAITSYARIYMYKIKLDILSKGGNIYYTDTDSIVTDIPLDNSLVGDKLGQFKLEFEVKKAYFITSKTYCVILKGNESDSNKTKVKIKVKGAHNTSLTVKDFQDMYNGYNVKAVKQNTITSYDKGSVNIYDKKITLKSDSYTNRDKIYKDNVWTDTKPIVYDVTNNIE
jgi:hypothetical protein